MKNFGPNRPYKDNLKQGFVPRIVRDPGVYQTSVIIHIQIATSPAQNDIAERRCATRLQAVAFAVPNVLNELDEISDTLYLLHVEIVRFM